MDLPQVVLSAKKKTDKKNKKKQQNQPEINEKEFTN